MYVCCECCVLSGIGLCDRLITRPEKSYRLWCVVVCDLETSRMRRPWSPLGRSATGNLYIYYIYIYIYLFIYFSRPIFNTLWQFPPAIYILRGVVRNRKSSPSLHTDIEVSHISEVYTGSIPEASFCDSPLNSSCRLRCIRKRRETCHMFHQNSTQDSVNRHLDTGFSWFPCV